MPRSIRKGPFIDPHLAKKVTAAVSSNNKRTQRFIIKRREK